MEKSETKKRKRLPLWGKVLIGLGIGIIAGLIAPEYAGKLKPIGTIFINLVKMLIVPLVFSSLMVGMTSVKDLKKVGRLGGKVFSFYLVTTAMAVVLGLVLCWIVVQFAPLSGMGAEVSDAAAEAVKERSVVDILIGLIPTNPVKAMADGDVLQIIVFAVFLGLACNLAGEKSRVVCELCDHLCNAMIRLTGVIMELAPIGVFALIAWTVSKYGGSSLKNLMLLTGIVYAGCIIQIIFVFGGALLFMGRLNPLKFFKGSFDAVVLAFSASSSSAALPVSMRCAKDNLGVSSSVVSFSLPLGATINMDGTAIYQGVCAMFVAQAWGIDLSIGQYATIVLTSCLGAIGTAGIPGAGLIMLSLVLSSVGLPLEAVGIIAGVDRLLDMARTAVNVCGDLVAAVIVAKSENELDIEVYNSAVDPS
jgi:Na+/H+-dicarboxylate symporter